MDYTPMYRPPSTFTIPKDFELIERPHAGLGFDRRTDLPLSKHKFGVVRYARPLTEHEIEWAQLKVVSQE